MEMSKAGMLMVFAPGGGDRNMQQVHTDEFGNVKVSLPLRMMDGSGKPRPDVPEELKLPIPLGTPPPEAIPANFGLKGCLSKPEPPKNPNPGFLSWLVYIFDINTEYAKMIRYQKEATTYEKRWDAWVKGLDDNAPGVKEYKAAKQETSTCRKCKPSNPSPWAWQTPSITAIVACLKTASMKSKRWTPTVCIRP